MNVKKTERELVYLYCVTNKKPKLIELEGLTENLYFIYYCGIYAVVSKVKMGEFGEEILKKNLADLQWLQTKARIHEKVIEVVMKNSSVIPFKFGTIFKSENSLKMSLNKLSLKLKSNLTYLESKEEWGIKVYCDSREVIDFLSRYNSEIIKMDKKIGSSSPGKAFLLNKKKKELLDKKTNEKLNEYCGVIFETLKVHCINAKLNGLLPKMVTEREDEMILNSALLVEKSKVPEFIRVADSLRVKYNNEGINFTFTGPWPPFNFCSIENGL